MEWKMTCFSPFAEADTDHVFFQLVQETDDLCASMPTQIGV